MRFVGGNGFDVDDVSGVRVAKDRANVDEPNEFSSHQRFNVGYIRNAFIANT